MRCAGILPPLPGWGVFYNTAKTEGLGGWDGNASLNSLTGANHLEEAISVSRPGSIPN